MCHGTDQGMGGCASGEVSSTPNNGQRLLSASVFPDKGREYQGPIAITGCANQEVCIQIVVQLDSTYMDGIRRQIGHNFAVRLLAILLNITWS